MRRRMAAFLVVVLSISLITSTRIKAEVRMEPGQIASDSYEEGVVLVKYVAKAPHMEGVTLVEEYSFPSFFIGRFQSKRYTTEQLMVAFEQLDDVIYVEPDYKYKSYAITEEDIDDNQWKIGTQEEGFDRLEEESIAASYSFRQLITATEKKAETVIAVLDTGVDYMQPSLVEHMWTNHTTLPGKHGYDFINEDLNPMDDDGHGTKCATMIVEESKSPVEIAGFYPNIKLMTVKALDDKGIGLTSSIVQAYQYVIHAKDQGANVIAISDAFGSIHPSKVLEDVIIEAGDKGILSVCTTKNFQSISQEEKSYPASYLSPYVIVATPGITAKVAILAQLFPEEAAARIRARVIGSDEHIVTTGVIDFAKQINLEKAIHNPLAVINRLDSIKGELTLTGYFFGEEEGSVAINGESVPVIQWEDTGVTVSYNHDFDGVATVTLFRGDDLSTTEQHLALTSIKYALDEAKAQPSNAPIQEKGQRNREVNKSDNAAEGWLWTFVIVAAIIVAGLIILVFLFGRKNRKR